MQTATGLDVLVRQDFRRLRGKTLGLLCNQASVTHDFEHVLDVILPFHRSGALKLARVFGPEHGLFGHAQDNMVEWEGVQDPRSGIPVQSLYGDHREPTPEMLEGLDLLLIDLPDVGARYYTFAWTMALTMGACARAGLSVVVLDRPNPIGGLQVEGPVLQPGFESFVGLYPLPARHGMTLGEVAQLVQSLYCPQCELSVVPMEGWSRGDYLDETDAPWVMPSPNMPTLDTAIVYPGACLLEGTNLSEGRGTTRPFETIGAPFLHGWNLCEALNALDLPGALFRPVQFQPTFNKHAGRICEGCFVHITERRAFEPVLTYVAILQQILRQTGLSELQNTNPNEVFVANSAETQLSALAWKQPPYEYESRRMPIDILAGNDWLRPAIEGQQQLHEIREQMLNEVSAFGPTRDAALSYSGS